MPNPQNKPDSFTEDGVPMYKFTVSASRKEAEEAAKKELDSLQRKREIYSSSEDYGDYAEELAGRMAYVKKHMGNLYKQSKSENASVDLDGALKKIERTRK